MGLSTDKKFISLVSVFLAATLLFGTTFAWQSINQEALNEIRGGTNPGGRLHDDFNNVSNDTHIDGTLIYDTKTYDKDVYVENFTSARDDGVQIYARIRLDEYMEIGSGAGTDSADKDVTVLGNANAKYDDRSTWTTYLFGDETSDFREYWDLSFGGQTSYMPTFNKNKDSLAADVNGTSAAGFADYVVYDALENQSETRFSVYDKDEDDADELSQDGVDLDALILNGNLDDKYKDDVYLASETHRVDTTIKGTVISIDQWLSDAPRYDADEQQLIGDYWVYDDDGWAYWASPIDPETATGLLLDQISRTTKTIESETGEWYYGINVVAQFITADSLGTPETDESKGTGFYDTDKGKAPSNKALMLLTAIGVHTNDVEKVMPIDESETTETVGSEEELNAAIELGGDVVLTEDITLTNSVTVENFTSLYMAGHEITASSDFTGDCLFTLCGKDQWFDFNNRSYLEAPADGYIVRVENGSELYIWEGTFVGGAGAIYVESGSADIYGGTFYLAHDGEGQLLDWNEDGGVAISIYGGTFYNFDPSNVSGISLLAEGYTVIASHEGEDVVYTVVPGVEDDPAEEVGEDDLSEADDGEVTLPDEEDTSDGSGTDDTDVSDESGSGMMGEGISGKADVLPDAEGGPAEP